MRASKQHITSASTTGTIRLDAAGLKALEEVLEALRKAAEGQPIPPLSAASTDGTSHPTELTDTAVLTSVLQGRLGLSASVLSPEQRKLLHTQMKTYISNHQVGINYRARNMPSRRPLKLLAGEGADAVLPKIFKSGSMLEKMFEMRERTKEIARGDKLDLGPLIMKKALINVMEGKQPTVSFPQGTDVSALAGQTYKCKNPECLDIHFRPRNSKITECPREVQQGQIYEVKTKATVEADELQADQARL